MGFARAENFLISVAKKYKVGSLAKSSLICERARKIISQKFANFSDDWKITKFFDGVLFIEVENSACSSALYLRTGDFLNFFKEEDYTSEIHEIRIKRMNKKVEEFS